MAEAGLKVGMRVIDKDGREYGTVAKLEIYHVVVLADSKAEQRFKYDEVKLVGNAVRITPIPNTAPDGMKQRRLRTVVSKAAGRIANRLG